MRKVFKTISCGKGCFSETLSGRRVELEEAVIGAPYAANDRARPHNARNLCFRWWGFFALYEPEQPLTNPVVRDNSARSNVCLRFGILARLD
ncbi:MAG: hypothetical protein JO227_11895 [Acetobacteraceae bacterium]|nr:hypothetical protein [Acetobacteraceae bacterium]